MRTPIDWANRADEERGTQRPAQTVMTELPGFRCRRRRSISSKKVRGVMKRLGPTGCECICVIS